MNSAADIAKYVVRFFHEREDLITNLKLQKLLYYIQGWHLGLYSEPAFTEELEAWVHGPAQPEIYRQYKKYQWNPITEAVRVPELGLDLTKHIDEVLSVYGTETAYSLERRTHLEDPWKLARNGLPPDAESNALITKQSMKIFFKKQMKNE